EALPVFWQGPVCGDEHVAEFGGVVPEVLFKLWRRVGFSGFLDGAMWLVDPLEWAAASEEMLRGVRVSFLEPGSLLVPVARSAFGEVWFWSAGCGVCLSLRPADGTQWEDLMESARTRPEVATFSWFATMGVDEMNLWDRHGDGLFEQALAAYGPVGPDECYGFVPSILLGGPAEVSHIQKVKVREHLFVLDKIRRGEFTAEVGPRATETSTVSELGSGGDGSSAAIADVESRIVALIADLASAEGGQSWVAAVGTSVKDSQGLYAHAVALYTPTGARRIVLLVHEELNRRLWQMTGELAELQGWRWEGLKVTVFSGGRSEIVYSYDPVEAMGWTSEIEGGVTRAELPNVLRPRGL
ncbi:GAD-like domain-containing protein, partial [Gordonia sp. DT30]|uniref:GAD-like domain-containing protein n=1 Tax=unclassified Gordonia (in: high G+C Gram-positive bacteria) TaxID=2657482 RepID=UPI003CF673F5